MIKTLRETLLQETSIYSKKINDINFTIMQVIQLCIELPDDRSGKFKGNNLLGGINVTYDVNKSEITIKKGKYDGGILINVDKWEEYSVPKNIILDCFYSYAFYTDVSNKLIEGFTITKSKNNSNNDKLDLYFNASGGNFFKNCQFNGSNIYFKANNALNGDYFDIDFNSIGDIDERGRINKGFIEFNSKIIKNIFDKNKFDSISDIVFYFYLSLEESDYSDEELEDMVYAKFEKKLGSNKYNKNIQLEME